LGVFKTYDIRGLYGQGIDEKLFYRVARAYARIVKGKTHIIGFDARIHSEQLYEAFKEGLLDEGRGVYGLGLCSTPALHYTQCHRHIDGAAMITASHNPAPYHGVKLFDSHGGSVSYHKGLSVIELMVGDMTDALLEPTAMSRNEGSFAEAGISDYLEFLAGAVGNQKFSQRIVIDASNGSAGPMFQVLCDRIALDAELINANPDGTFPAHDPNPLKETSRAQIRKRVRETGADLGAILDGDGDRIIFVDEKGQPVENYFISALIAEEVLRTQEGGAVVYDLISSRALPERIRELGGRPIVSRVGYTFLYDSMVAHKACFGTETSGHVYFRVTDTYYTESAAFALLTLLKMLSRVDRPLSELVRPLRERYAQAPETNLEVENKQAALGAVERRFAGFPIDRTDGISVEAEDYWFNVRASNTEPLIRVRLEARERDIATVRLQEIVDLIAGEEK
jgi:phosphomannomutase